MRFTASLANLIMKKWDMKWQELCEREGLVVDMQLRYVDDCRVFCPFINEGWKWRDGGFHFSWQDRENDLKSGQSDIQRTTLEITNSMCSLVEFLEFTGEEHTMFESNKLPTLDTELWYNGDNIKFSFYEKPTVSNRVIQ